MNPDSKRLFIWLTAGIFLVGSFLAIMFAGGPGDDQSTPLGEIDLQQEWHKGNPEAKVIIVEYSDFQCPACKAREPMIKDLMDEFREHVAFVYRHLPLKSLHANAELTARASEAAGLQKKFWEMHDLIFETQDIWKDLSNSEAEKTFIGYARQIGLDEAKFSEDLNSSNVDKEVQKDANSANSLGLNSTPTFFLNGERIEPGSYNEFRELVRAALQKQDAI